MFDCGNNFWGILVLIWICCLIFLSLQSMVLVLESKILVIVFGHFDRIRSFFFNHSPKILINDRQMTEKQKEVCSYSAVIKLYRLVKKLLV